MLQFQNVYLRLEGLAVIGAFFRNLRYPLKAIIFYLFQRKSRLVWMDKITTVIQCPDNHYITRVAQAGQIVDGYQIMHNGIKIVPGSYYGEANRMLIEKNRGVHEPQEERAFAEVLRYMPTGAVMIELGAYWGFYSMWFHEQVKNANCYLVEPALSNLKYGQANFKANGKTGKFVQAYVGAQPGKSEDGTPIIAIDSFAQNQRISHIHILHADIQGYEYEMLVGARNMLVDKKIDYIFISTHSNILHEQCKAFLQQCNFFILADVDLDESYTTDGVLVARHKDVIGMSTIPTSKKQKSLHN